MTDKQSKKEQVELKTELLSDSDVYSSQLSDSEPLQDKHEYKHLEQFTQSENTLAVNEDEPKAELEMGKKDSEHLAAFGVAKVNKVLPYIFGAPVGFDDEQQQELAESAAPLVKKYYGEANLPSWLKVYKDEISFGLSLSTALFGCWMQAKEHHKNEDEENKTQSKPDFVTVDLSQREGASLNGH
jgi:hypothetical protein